MRSKPYIVIILSTLILAGCKEDMVNLIPITSSSTAGFYKTGQDMINAINAAYGTLQSGAAAGNEFMFGDVTTDDAQAVSGLYAQGHGDFDNYTSSVSSSNAGQVSNRWTGCYSGISRVNIILNRIDAIQMDAALKSRIIGEAKFLRAYYYFNLVKVFGSVPLVLEEITTPDQAYTYGRDTTAEIFTQIQKDLTDAAATLPPSYSGTDVGRATSGAAKGMMARVLIWQKKFSDAAPLLQSIITTQSPGTYDLLPDYSDIFKSANSNNKEILFAVQYAPNSVALGESGNPVGSFNPGSIDTLSKIGFLGNNADQPTQDLFDFYDPDDLRRDANIRYSVVGGVPTAYCNKYISPGVTNSNENGTDYPVLRYADILLMYAECLNEGGDPGAALPYINKVRQRAFGNNTHDLQMGDPGNTATYVADQAAMRDRIIDERRMELAFEGLRFFDLVRTDRLVSVMNAYFARYNLMLNGTVIVIGNNNKLFPVPLTQINLNPGKITQNPGYN